MWQEVDSLLESLVALAESRGDDAAPIYRYNIERLVNKLLELDGSPDARSGLVEWIDELCSREGGE